MMMILRIPQQHVVGREKYPRKKLPKIRRLNHHRTLNKRNVIQDSITLAVHSIKRFEFYIFGMSGYFACVNHVPTNSFRYIKYIFET